MRDGSKWFVANVRIPPAGHGRTAELASVCCCTVLRTRAWWQRGVGEQVRGTCQSYKSLLANGLLSSNWSSGQ
jgi:hypothetical protein